MFWNSEILPDPAGKIGPFSMTAADCTEQLWKNPGQILIRLLYITHCIGIDNLTNYNNFEHYKKQGMLLISFIQLLR